MTTRLPVSCCIIVRDNPQIGILLRLIRDYVAEIVVVDTGSTDATPEIAKALADRFEVFTDCNGPDGKINDFSKARARSFALATQEIVLWADSDDEPDFTNLRSEIEVLRALRAQITKPVLFRYGYDYGFQGNSVAVRHIRERMFLRSDLNAFQWEGRVHELFLGVDQNAVALVNRTGMTWTHRRTDVGRESDRDLRILQLTVEDEGGLEKASLRALYCLAGELIQRKRHAEAAEVCVAYLARPGVTVERSFMYGYRAKMDLADGWYQSSLAWALLYFANSQGDIVYGIDSPGIISDTVKDPALLLGAIYRELALEAASLGDQARADHAHRSAVRFFRMGLSLANNATTSTFPHATFAARLNFIECLRALERDQEALTETEAALALAPRSAQFLKHRGELNMKTTKKSLVENLGQLVEWGAVDQTGVEAIHAALTAPPTLAHASTEPPPPLSMRGGPEAGKLDIILACGDTREEWNPKRVDEVGVGGSETAACDWARGMAARGHRVRVYTRCGEPAVYDDVEYLPSAMLKGARADVAVAWRFPPLLDLVEAPSKFVWAHDPTLQATRAAHRVVALSEWHRKSILKASPVLKPDQVTVIGGAIRVEDFADGGTTERDPHKAVCMSAHERHLLAFIDIWPKIRAAVPDATLELFYGYDEWKRMPTNAAFAEHIRYFDRKRPMLETMGITFHPRLPPKEIAKKMLGASLWLYPTHWPECWPAVAAQALTAGLDIVSTELTGTSEIVGVEGALIQGTGHPSGWTLEPGYQSMFVAAAVSAMQNPLQYEYRNARRHRSSERFGWSARLDDWERLLQQDVRTARSHVTTDYERFVAESVAAIKETPRVDFPLSHVLALPELRHAGLWLEFGVFRGRSLKMLAAAKGDAKVFGFDTFQGLPEDWKPGIPKGSFSVGGRLPDVPGAEFVVGLFEDTLLTFRFEAPVTLAHIDCDIGSAAQTALKAIRPHLADVSHIVFDELWNYAEFADHEMKALYDQLVTHGFEIEFLAHSKDEQVACRVTRRVANTELYDAAFYADNACP